MIDFNDIIDSYDNGQKKQFFSQVEAYGQLKFFKQLFQEFDTQYSKELLNTICTLTESKEV